MKFYALVIKDWAPSGLFGDDASGNLKVISWTSEERKRRYWSPSRGRGGGGCYQSGTSASGVLEYTLPVPGPL